MSEKTTLYIPEWRDNPVLARCLGPSRGVLDWREDARRDDAVQRILAEVHRREGYLECRCRTPRPRLYVARHGRFYRLCRYPATGGDHDEKCVFFERDGGGSRSETAPAGRREDVLRLKVGRRIEADRPSAGHTLPPRDGGGHGTSRARQRLFGFFRDLWEGADLNVHRPGLRKTWPVVRAALARRADGVTWAGAPLAESLLSPIPPGRDNARGAEIAQTRAALEAAVARNTRVILIAPLWRWLRPKNQAGREHAVYDLAIGGPGARPGGNPYDLHAISGPGLFNRLAASWPRAAAVVDARSRKGGGDTPESAALAADVGVRIVLTGVARPFRGKRRPGFTLIFDDACLDLLTRDFMPCDSAHEMRLARWLACRRHRFRKPLTASEWNGRVPDFELLDVGTDPVPLEVYGLADAAYLAAKAEKIAMYRRSGRRFWHWNAGGASPQSLDEAVKTLPPPNA